MTLVLVVYKHGTGLEARGVAFISRQLFGIVIAPEGPGGTNSSSDSSELCLDSAVAAMTDPSRNIHRHTTIVQQHFIALSPRTSFSTFVICHLVSRVQKHRTDYVLFACVVTNIHIVFQHCRGSLTHVL
jgi:hypothetical protein